MTDQQKRQALLDECKRMEALHTALVAEADETLTDDDFDTWYEQEYARFSDAHAKKWNEAFFLQFPRRRGWFADVFIASFGDCENLRLTQKQTEVVKRYCVADGATWSTGKTYCRAGGKTVTLCIPRYSRGIGYITIK